MEAPDECGHQGNAEKKKLSVELIDKKVVGFLKKTLENHNIAYKMMILPDHPTPVSTKTHASEPVPYVIYSSDNSTPSGLKYCEENGKKTGVYFDSGVSLMKHFLEN